MRRTWYLLGMALVLTGTAALAQPQPQAAPDDSAQRGVARLSIVSGDVSIQRGDSGERTAAAVNAPLMAGDVVATGPGGRAEVQFDYANLARVASDSEVRLSELAASHYQLQVGRGTMMFAIVRDSRAQVEVSTPQVSMRPAQRGAYRISVFDDGHAEITVRVGQAEIYTPSGTETLDPGKTMMVRGSSSDPEFQMVNAIEQDDFDHWSAGRDQTLSRSTSSRHVSPDIYGTEDLDNSGRWVNTPDYGTVWAPTVGPDWAPYRNGQWVWEDWYGWTWVSYDSWGWAPYHYGRWFYRGGIGWAWYPGPVFTRCYWSPALVAFFGFGGFHVGVGFGGPGFGWVPLGPYEAIHPWWGRGFYGGYHQRNVLINNINVANNVNVYNTYRNARVANGVTAINSNEFGRGRVTSTMRVSPEQLRSASLVRGQVPIAPSAASLRFSNRAVTTPARATNFNDTRFYSHNQPAAVNRVPFAQQQRSLGEVTGRATASTGAWRQANPTVARGGATSSTPAANNSSNGWRRFGEPSASSTSRGSVSPQSSANNGWHTSGDRPSTAAQPSRQSSQADSWRRFPSTSSSPSAAPRYSSPSSSSPRSYSSPGYSSPRSLQIAPPIVRERSSSPSYSSPRSSSGGSSSGGHSTYSAPSSHPSGGGSGGGGHSGGGGGGSHGHR